MYCGKIERRKNYYYGLKPKVIRYFYTYEGYQDIRNHL